MFTHRRFSRRTLTAAAAGLGLLILAMWLLNSAPVRGAMSLAPAASSAGASESVTSTDLTNIGKLDAIDPDSVRLAGATSPAATNATHKVGVEWINTFPGWPSGNRDAWDDSCDGLFWTVQLGGKGWTPGFHYTENQAWETDWKSASNGGSENTYADSVDLAMLCSHGARATDTNGDGKLRTSVMFSQPYHDDRDISPGDAWGSFGDNNLEWLAFDSCAVLDKQAHVAPTDPPAPTGNLASWFKTFNGLHLMLGFKNDMSVIQPGDGLLWGIYMTGFGGVLPPSSVLQSWFWAVDYVQPSGVTARVVAEVQNNYNDYLWGYGYVSPDPVHNGKFYYWTHGSQNSSGLLQAQSTTAPITTMPILQVVPRTVDSAYVSAIATAMGISGTIGTNGRFYAVSNPTGTLSLLVDIPSGGFAFHNLAKLGVPPTTTLTLPSWDQAGTIASTFFRGRGAGLPGVANRGQGIYGVDEITEDAVSTSAQMMEQTTAITPTNATVTYGRTISVSVGTISGTQPTYAPIVGAGARLLVYLGDHGEIIGMQGGTRDVQMSNQQVTIMSADEAWAMYQANPRIAAAQIDLPTDPTDAITPTVKTLGYYEQPHWDAQAELIPVWIFTVATGVTETADIYVPAAQDYLPPQVQIDAPTPGTVVSPRQMISLTGSVVQYGKPPFTYSWTANGQGPLGSGASITAALSTEIKSSNIYSQTISLDVRDANGQHGTATTTVFVLSGLYLPVLSK